MILTVSVIVPAYNEEANLRQGVAQVLDEPWPDELLLREIIIIDDCSGDATPKIAGELASADSRIRTMSNQVRRGKNAGIRDAASSCQSDVAVVIDADVLLSPGSLIHTLELLVADASLMASSCIIRPLPARSWRERASRSQALFVAELKRRGSGYLSALYAVRAPAYGALDIPDGVADDAYVTLWLKAHDYRYAVCNNAIAFIRAASGIVDFAKQTLRGRYGAEATARIAPPAALPNRRQAVLPAVIGAFIKDPAGFVLYAMWYAIVLATPKRWWLQTVSLSVFETAKSTKYVRSKKDAAQMHRRGRHSG